MSWFKIIDKNTWWNQFGELYSIGGYAVDTLAIDVCMNRIFVRLSFWRKVRFFLHLKMLARMHKRISGNPDIMQILGMGLKKQ
jgi:hypothetical protein